MVRWVIPATAAMLMQGCAYGTAIRRGADAAEEGRWDVALTEYRSARDRKADGEEALAGVARASSELANAAVEAARAHVGKVGWGPALDRVAVAEGYVPTHTELPGLRYDIEAGMVHAATALRDGGKFREAYVLAASAKHLFPEAPAAPAAVSAPTPPPAPEPAAEPETPAAETPAGETPAAETPAPETPAVAAEPAPAETPSEAVVADETRPLDALLASLRTHFLDEAATHRTAKAFGDAVASAAIVAENEPDRADEVAVLTKEISAEWADDLVATAATAPYRTKKGVQAVLRARAFEVAGRPEDRDAARALAAEVAPAGQVSLKTTIKGPRPGPYDAALTAFRTAHPEVRPAAARSTLAVNLVVAAPKCTQVAEKAAKTKEYVAKTIKVANPAFAEATKAAAAASTAAESATDALAPLKPAVDAATAAARTAEAARAKIEMESGEAAGKLAAAKTQLAAATTDELKQQWQTEVDKLEASASSADTRAKAAAAEKASADTALAEATAKLDAGKKAEADAASASRTADATLAKTPEMLDKDVMDTFAYDEKTWTRTCLVSVALSAVPAWKSSLPAAAPLTASTSVTDVEHPGFEKAAVVADPLKFAKDDAALVSEADTTITSKLAADLDARIVDHYKVRLAEADADADPHAATERLVAMWVGAPQRLGEEGRKVVAAHLADTYGLKDPSVLGAPAASETTAAASPAASAPTDPKPPADEGANN